MSTLDEKLEQHAPSLYGSARATLKQLNKRFGSPNTGKTVPELVVIRCMGEVETWKRAGHPQKPIGNTAYDLIERTRIEEE